MEKVPYVLLLEVRLAGRVRSILPGCKKQSKKQKKNKQKNTKTNKKPTAKLLSLPMCKCEPFRSMERDLLFINNLRLTTIWDQRQAERFPGCSSCVLSK